MENVIMVDVHVSYDIIDLINPYVDLMTPYKMTYEIQQNLV